jgi:hypothetical protein
MTRTPISTNEMLGLLWRVAMLDAPAFQELRDRAHLTLISAGGLVAAVVIAGFGAWLYSHTAFWKAATSRSSRPSSWAASSR